MTVPRDHSPILGSLSESMRGIEGTVSFVKSSSMVQLELFTKLINSHNLRKANTSAICCPSWEGPLRTGLPAEALESDPSCQPGLPWFGGISQIAPTSPWPAD